MENIVILKKLIIEATECDFKVEVEREKPKSWLKSVSAFANGIGGTLFFGVDDDNSVVGLDSAQSDAEFISQRIKAHISPTPEFILTPNTENEMTILALEVQAGRSTPYYYVNKGTKAAYIRIGNESNLAPDYILNELKPKFYSDTSFRVTLYNVNYNADEQADEAENEVENDADEVVKGAENSDKVAIDSDRVAIG